MTFIFLRTTSLLALLVACLTTFSAFAQQKVVAPSRTQQAIAMDLVSSDYDVMVSALEDYIRVPEESRTPQLRAALVTALAMENERRKQFFLGDRPYLYEGDDTSGLALYNEVMAMRDPATIPALLPWLCCGDAGRFIDFGNQIFQPVLQFIHAAEPGYERSMQGGLWVLRMMVDYWGLSSFSDAEHEQLRQIALRHISGDYMPDGWLELEYAIQLAASIRDMELVRMAEAVVNDEDELRKRGITFSPALEYLSKTVTDAISGNLQLRQYVPRKQRMIEREALDTSP